MLLANIPAWFAKRFGADATGSYIRTVPATTADPNAASMALGFPPNTFVDEGAGGSPPDGRDFNGILNYLSAWTQWIGAGGPIPWNSTVAAAGYPIGSVVQSTVTAGLMWRSTVDGNTTNPDAAGAGWTAFSVVVASVADIQAATSALLIVTPKNLRDAGYDRITSQSLIPNFGYRVHASGFKQCWGRQDVPAGGQQDVTLPVTHTTFVMPALGAEISVTAGSSLKVGLSPPGLNTFTIFNRDTVDRSVTWQSVGV